MIRPLQWDSNFFSSRIGKIDIGNDGDFAIDQEDFAQFDMVYIFSPHDLNLDLPLMDIKITMGKSVKLKSKANEIKLFDPSVDNYDQLLELVYLSGHQSRFLKDSFFGRKKFEKMYQTWINNSLHKEKSKVLIYRDHGNIAGFVSFYYNKVNAAIELIAVDPSFQGKNIGTKLLTSVESFLSYGFELQVATQATNVKARDFYLKNDFEIINKQYIYHFAPHSL